jgi:AcrR family transcriptional regulator
MAALPNQTPQPGLRERKKQQTRRHIAETARQLFTERGFDAVKVSEVARAADVSEKTVFNYFPTKEDLVYWRLEAFEAELLQTIRDREPGDSVLAGFRRFIVSQRGLLGQADPEARDQLTALTRMITESPALQRREGEVFAGYTAALAGLIAEETGAGPDDVPPRVAAHAMIGVHQALIAYTRRGVLAGELGPRLGRDARRQADRALGLLEGGLGDYAVKGAQAAAARTRRSAS